MSGPAARMLPHTRGMDHRCPRRVLPVLLVSSLLAGGRAQASELRAGHAFLAGAGWFDCNRRRDQAAEVRLEYRSSAFGPGLRGVAATLATTDGSLFVGAGVAYELLLGRWDVTPTFVPGLYWNGGGRDLGYPLEFRSQVELGYRLRGGQRVALGLSHISNAGLGARNPGQESVTISYEWSPHR